MDRREVERWLRPNLNYDPDIPDSAPEKIARQVAS